MLHLSKKRKYFFIILTIILFFSISVFFSFPAMRKRLFIFIIWFIGEIYLWMILKKYTSIFNYQTASSKFQKAIRLCSIIIYWLPATYIIIVLGLHSFCFPQLMFQPKISLFLGICVVFYLLKFIAGILFLIIDCFFKIFIHFNPEYIQFKWVINYPIRTIKTLSIIILISLCMIIYGILFTAKNLECKHITISDAKLPVPELKIIHISDLHLIFFQDKPEFLEEIIHKVNQENPDIIAFTGDAVSFTANEFASQLKFLKKFKAKYGIYSVLGNHDYGNYIRWSSEREQIENLKRLCQLQKESGWILLNNENRILKLDSSAQIQIAGIEFWNQDAHFQNFGNLKKTEQGLNSNNFILFLSHNPKLWRKAIAEKIPFNLMLSGHTHAMQIGIQKPCIHWSPASLIYPEWGGLYESDGHYLYVNTGLSTVGIPMRLGIRPEITIIHICQN